LVHGHEGTTFVSCVSRPICCRFYGTGHKWILDFKEHLDPPKESDTQPEWVDKLYTDPNPRLSTDSITASAPSRLGIPANDLKIAPELASLVQDALQLLKTPLELLNSKYCKREEKREAIRSALRGLMRPVPPTALEAKKVLKPVIRDEQTEARDKYIYEECCKGVRHRIIRSHVNSHEGWEPLGSDTAIKDAAGRYVGRHPELPYPPPRQKKK
jgi:hypothetical protein